MCATDKASRINFHPVILVIVEGFNLFRYLLISFCSSSWKLLPDEEFQTILTGEYSGDGGQRQGRVGRCKLVFAAKLITTRAHLTTIW